ncbi:FAD-dependent oxidoreductase [Desmospora profundinema]|uniref:2-polyprenyl-6-methoxyphenol hydroxylase-like FAD-dependent oxidoreductase n=1 Tax=Desmospora profundinema TaxID=1571184 RepID=A0ABU1IL68_9BACL|nr:NAD(P)/FAD-dependent oxidoreductase [Desmospora profundinema]MDR6225153.1 2-polyprenyl-6-methoxyphenol hydroxylase-like FAD-dependent oxidoreductase [Desmospora profundinema]
MTNTKASQTGRTAGMKKKVLIVGCGIAGPATALFLKRAGFDPVIFEARKAPDDQAGFFLNIAANGLDVLRTLGLEDPILEQGFLCEQMTMWNQGGKRLGDVPNGSRGRCGIIIKRGVLHRVIREEAIRQGVPVRFGKKLEGIQVNEGGRVTARFADGTEDRGDLLVGCDGIHSRTRRILFPDSPQPTYTGMVGFGGFAHHSSIPPTSGTMHMIFGKQAFFGYLVKPSGDIYWFNNVAFPREPSREELNTVTHEKWRRRLLDWHRVDPSPVQEIIRSTKGDIGVFPIHDIPYQATWYEGPVVLIGDAAHATSPHAGQGASMALEDGIVLVKCLRDIPCSKKAFAMYQALRKERVGKLVRMARKNGQNKMVSDPVRMWFRDQMMRVAFKFFVNERAIDWIYSYRVDWEETVEEIHSR